MKITSYATIAMPRERSLTALLEEVERKADWLMLTYAPFMTGTRVLLLLKRAKEGGHNKESKRRRAREVAHTPEDIRKALVKLLVLKATSLHGDHRIYMSAAPRDIRKAEMEFKSDMLQADFAEHDNKIYFWENLEERWISALMAANPMKGENVFILDADTPEDEPTKDVLAPVLKWCAENGIEIIQQYPTKHGWHVATKPFNRTLYPPELGEVKVDALILLDW